MTRWARSGNTQKHKKMPGDATPWEEFSTASKSKPKEGGKINKIRRGRIEKKKHNLKQKLPLGVTSKIEQIKTIIKTEPANFKFSKKRNLLNSKLEDKKVMAEKEHSIMDVENNKGNDTPEVIVSVKNQLKKARQKEKIHKLKTVQSKEDEVTSPENRKGEKMTKNSGQSYQEKESIGKKKFAEKKGLLKNKAKPSENYVDNVSLTYVNLSSTIAKDDQQMNEMKKRNKNAKVEKNDTVLLDAGINKVNDTTETKVLSKAQLKRAKKKKRIQEIIAMQSNQNNEMNSKNKKGGKSTENNGKSSLDKNNGKSSLDSDFLGKKKLFMEKLQRKRAQNGITLLPSKVERKIYNIKKALREKGMPIQTIKEIIRKERRTAELKFRSTFSTKPCYSCRQTGHLLAECPLRLGNSNQATGICFKCGSTEHVSYKCPKKVEGYPLAKCFVCKEQGHISKDCPKNEHGVYPKGGKCTLCGNINHLRKDCPSLSKNKEETVLTAHTINEGTSIDAEIVEDVTVPKKKKTKQPKVVKF